MSTNQFGEELGGDPAGDADRDTEDEPPGGRFGEELGGDPAGDADRQTEDREETTEPDREAGGFGEELGGDPAGEGAIEQEPTAEQRRRAGVVAAAERAPGPDDVLERGREAARRGREAVARARGQTADIFRRPEDFDVRDVFGQELGGDPAGDADRTLEAFEDRDDGQEILHREPVSESEREAQAELIGRSELIDPEDVVFVRRNGRIVATVDTGTAEVLGRTGFQQDDFVVEGGRSAQVGLGETGGGEDLPFATGGDPASIALAEAERNLEIAAGLAESVVIGTFNLGDGDTERTAEASEAQLSDARANIEQQLETQLKREFGVEVELGQEDIDFTRDGDEISGELSRAGRKKVAVERAPFTDAPVVGPVFEAGAEIDFEADIFREKTFRKPFFEAVGQREEALEALEDLGLRDEFDTFQDVSARAQAQLDGIKERIEGIDVEDVGKGLVAAGAAGIVAPEPVTSVGGAGAVAVGGGIIVGSAAAGALASIDQEAPQVEAATVDVFPTEQEIPEDRALFESELPIEEPNVFLPEVLVPTAPAQQFTAGRFTPPEVAVETAEPTEPFGGPEVPVDTDDPGEVFGGAEIPTPTIEAQAQQTIQQADEAVGEIERRRPGRGRPTVPREFIPEEPGFIGKGVGIGGGVVFRRGTTRSLDPKIIETPFADIDIAGIDPALARVLEVQALELDPLEDVDFDVGVQPGQLDLPELDAGVGVEPREDQRTEARADTRTGQRTTVDVDQRERTRVDHPTARPTAVEAPSIGVGTPTDVVLEDEPFAFGTEFGTAPGRRPARLPRFDFDLDTPEPSFDEVDVSVKTGVFEHRVPTVKEFERRLKALRKKNAKRRRKRKSVETQPVEAPGVDIDFDQDLDDIDPF